MPLYTRNCRIIAVLLSGTTMNPLPDFTETELKVIKDTLKERYDEPVEVQCADSELRLHPGDRELTICPVVYWVVGKCHFVICKTGQTNFRCQFFYSVREEYGTGTDEYTDILDCIVTLLHVQADHEIKMNNGNHDSTTIST